MDQSDDCRWECKQHTNERREMFATQQVNAKSEKASCQTSNKEIVGVDKPQDSHCQVSKHGNAACKRLLGLFCIECDVKIHDRKHAKQNAITNGTNHVKN